MYSRALAQAGVSGKVCIDAVTDERGNVVKERAVCGNSFLIPAALEAVGKWRYEPTYLNGVPVPLELTVVVNFHLRGSGASAD